MQAKYIALPASLPNRLNYAEFDKNAWILSNFNSSVQWKQQQPSSVHRVSPDKIQHGQKI